METLTPAQISGMSEDEIMKASVNTQNLSPEATAALKARIRGFLGP